MNAKNKCVDIRLSFLAKAILLALSSSTFIVPSYSYAANACNTSDGINGSAPASGNCTLPSYDPQINDNKVGAAYVDSGTISLTGNINIKPGLVGGGTSIDIANADNLQLLDAPAGSTVASEITLTLGARDNQIVIYSPSTGSNISILTFDSEKISEKSLSSIKVGVKQPVNGEQYVDARFGTATNNGKLEVDIGNSTKLITDESNWIGGINYEQMALKQSDLTLAQNGGIVEWKSKNFIWTDTSDASLSGTYTGSYEVAVYNNVTYTESGITHTVNNINELKKYNDWLIAKLKLQNDPNMMTEEQYRNAIDKAVTSETRRFSYTDSTDFSHDEMAVGANQNSVIRATGTNSKGIISGQLDTRIVSTATAIAENNGTIEITDTGKLSGIFTLLKIGAGSSGINNGVISAGYRIGNNLDTTKENFDQYGSSYFQGWAVDVDGNGAKFTNNGIMNVAGWSSTEPSYTASNNYLIAIDNEASAINNGIMNVSVNNNIVNNNQKDKGQTYAVVIGRNGGSGSFSNSESGEIYIGRGAQYDVSQPESVVDTTNKVEQYGVFLVNGQVVNDGKITIGSLTQNAKALFSSGSDTNSKLINNGSIVILGDSSSQENPIQNIGIYAENTNARIEHNGIINIKGNNNKGIQIISNDLSQGQLLTGSGSQINVSDAGLATYRNFGIWAEGIRQDPTGSDPYLARLSGEINLSGDNVIGVHARDGAKILVETNGSINFISTTAENQIGYFIHGLGSKIEINADSNSTQEVTTKNSTLYRIENGANYNGQSTAPLTLKSSGENSTILHVTSQSKNITDYSELEAGNLKLSVKGNGATGVKVEGGAYGKIQGGTVFVGIEGDGTTAGIVDGDYYNILGNYVSNVGTAKLDTYATLSASNIAKGAFGYIVRNNGTLNHYGDINLTGPTVQNATGILVEGGTLYNDTGKTIKVDGKAVHIKGSTAPNDSTIKYQSIVNNLGTVEAINGQAAFYVDNEALLQLTGSGNIIAQGTADGVFLNTGAKGLTVDGAKIDVTGTGNGIENFAEFGGIQLKGNSQININNGIGVHTGKSLAQTNSGNINVTGSGVGIAFEKINTNHHVDSESVGTTDGELDMSDSSALIIMVTGAGGRGILTDTTQDLNTNITINVDHAAGGEALIVKGQTEKIKQSGSLTSQSATSAVVDINNGYITDFTNAGIIKALNQAQTAIYNNSGNGVNFTNATGGQIIGKVNLLAGDNIVTLETGSKGSDFYVANNGNNTFILKDITETETTLFNTLNGGLGSGSDILKLDNSAYIFNNTSALNNIENVHLTNNSIFTLDHIINSFALGDNSDDASNTGYTIDQTSKLVIDDNSNVALQSHLAGTGEVYVNTTGNNFDFTTNNQNDGFTGTLHLGNTKFELGGINTQALTSANLKVGTGSLTHVNSGAQNIGKFTFAGGLVAFDTGTPGPTISDGYIHSINMDLSGSGTVQVDIDAVNNVTPVPPNTLSLLEQDEGQIVLQLAKSDNTVVGSAGGLTLQDHHGNAITNGPNRFDIDQNGVKVAEGTYDYRLTSGSDNDGLYINYGLTQLNLLGTDTNALILDANGKTGAAADMSAKITGNGDLAINSNGGETVSLSNLNNDYSGQTDVRSGNLAMASDNALGHTSKLNLANSTQFTMAGYSQIIGALAMQSGSLLDIAGGNLTISNELNSMASGQLNTDLGSHIKLNGGALTAKNGGTVNGSLEGNGKLTVGDGINASSLVINGSNASLSATATIQAKSQVTLNSVRGLGVGKIDMKGDSVLLFDNATTGQLVNDFSSNDNQALIKLTNSDITLKGNNSNYSGIFSIDSDSKLEANQSQHLGSAKVINDGELVLNNTNIWSVTNIIQGSGDLVKQGTGTIKLDSNSGQYTGQTDIQNGGIILGANGTPVALASNHVEIGANSFFGGFGSVAGSINNLGRFFVGTDDTTQLPTTPASIFTVNGNFDNQGEIYIGQTTNINQVGVGNTLLINGDYIGQTDSKIYINTILGNSTSVTDVMRVTGDTFGSSEVKVNNVGGLGDKTTGDGILLIAVRGASNGTFTQGNRIMAGGYDYTLVRGTTDSDSWYLSSRSGGTGPNVTRPEGSAYLGNLVAANTMFNMRLHDRLGETQYTDLLTGEQKVTSMWMRYQYGYTKFDDSGQIQGNKTRWNMTQIGGDIASWSSDGLDRFHLGLMVGQGRATTKTGHNYDGYHAKGTVDGYSFGVYGTWYANNQDKTGLYVDSWLIWNNLKATMEGEGTSTSENYKIKGYIASVESGYTYLTHQGEKYDWWLQPKAQLTWTNVDADDYVEKAAASYTKVTGDSNNLETRIGLRLSAKANDELTELTNNSGQLFIEANWLHNTKPYQIELGNSNYKQLGARNIAELKLGVEGEINKHTNIWFNSFYQVGKDNYSGVGIRLGLKYSF